jgi:hypothetical protein
MTRHSVSRPSASKRTHSTTKVPSPPRQTHVSSSGSAWAAVDAANASKMGHSPSHATTPIEMKGYNELRNNKKVQKAIKAREKLGELLGRPLRYGATQKEINDRTAKIMEYERIVNKYQGLLGDYDQAKKHYEQFNPKLKGGKSVRRNKTNNRRKGTRRFRR